MSEGSVFEIPTKHRSAADTQPAHDPVNILVVDDLPEKLLVYEMVLKDLGQNVVMAKSGEEALKLLLKHEFAVILLDVNMPGMDGFETASMIRRRKNSAGTPIIFLTAFNDEMRMHQGYATGAVDYLPTPVVPQVLQAKVKVFIELFQMRRRAAMQAEERARRIAAEEADQHKDEFLGMLAHELRNPLSPILNAAQLLRRFKSDEQRLEKLQEVIERQVIHMSRLIDDLLDATRLAHGRILLREERCDLAKIVRQTTGDYRNLFDADAVQLDIIVPLAPIWVEGDPVRLAQIVGNLLHNAHKFTGSGGRVTVQLATGEDDTAVLTVTDTGIGMAPEILPHIFDVFRQAEQGLDRKRGGLGLGLTLVKGLMDLHHGTIVAASEGEGKGSCFTLTLPTIQKPLSIHTPPSPEALLRQPSAKRRILVIDDNRDAAESVQTFLDLDGHEVMTAHTGSFGIETARSFKPDVIICDIGLPGMSGYEVARAIRDDKNLSSAYMIALTGYGRDEDRNQAQRAGFDIHLSKPIDCEHLRDALAHCRNGNASAFRATGLVN
jgi:signal transduction histidine kinase